MKAGAEDEDKGRGGDGYPIYDIPPKKAELAPPSTILVRFHLSLASILLFSLS